MKKTLLLADDSPTIQKVINLTFADEGIDVIAVSDGNAALQQLREMTPDLVMADVHMPGLNGYQICERLRQNEELKKVPVILLVGSFEPFDEEEAKRVGADDFLMKPFQSIRQLVSRVTALLENGTQEETPAPVEQHTAEASDTAEQPAELETPSEEKFLSISAPEPALEIAAEQVPAPEEAVEVTGEDDDLADFDMEFDRKFPDAAALSSENLESIAFSPVMPQVEETASAFESHESAESREASEEEAFHESVEAPVTEDAENVAAEAEIFTHQPERIDDEEEPIAAVETETAPVLDLDDGRAMESAQEGAIFLELESDEPAAEIAAEPEEKAIEPFTGESPAIEMAEQAEPEPEVPAFDTQQYDFRSPDAFDEDIDIKETFHGLVTPEKQAVTQEQVVAKEQVVAQEQAVAEEQTAPVFGEPLERIVDEETLGSASEDQADGFSEVGAAAGSVPVSPEAVDAVAQRVFEQISEKVVTELVRGIMPDIKELIAREIAKERE